VPLRQLIEAGARIALGADDPLLFGSRLSAQYEVARTEHGLSDIELAGLARGSVRGSWAPESARKQMLKGIDEWLAS
jgi:adenosine deaminase